MAKPCAAGPLQRNRDLGQELKPSIHIVRRCHIRAAKCHSLPWHQCREGLGIEIDFSLPAERVVRPLNQIIEWRGAPGTILAVHGPEYVSGTHREWAENRGITLAYIQPGKPQQKAYVERCNRTVRHDWLDLCIFESTEEVQQFATEWLWSYNNERPNTGNGGMTPAQKLRMAA